MVSLWTMGAMASKKARASSPVRAAMAAARPGEVSGPLAMITLSHSGGGRAAISWRATVTKSSASRAASTAFEKPSRSTASAPPAGTRWASPAPRMMEPARRISSCRSPMALVSASSERNEFEHTSSARPPVRWASVARWGRISWRTVGTPARASCQAASDPARPPPITWTEFGESAIS